MQSTLIAIGTSGAIIDRRPVYALLARCRGQTYFVTWEHRSRLDALAQVASWAVETMTPVGIWYRSLCEAEGTGTRNCKNDTEVS